MKRSRMLSLLAAAVLFAVTAVAQQPPDTAERDATGPEHAVDVTEDAAPADQPPPPAEEADDAPAEEGWARYAVLYQRNIFSRSRTRPRPVERQRDRTPEPPPPSAESWHVLKGVVRQNGRFIAFVEDTRDGGLIRLRSGDAVARGSVQALTLDSLDYRLDNVVTRIEIGSNLEGEHTAPVITADQLIQWSRSAPVVPAASDAATQPETTDDEAELLRQLMERRRQELGQQ